MSKINIIKKAGFGGTSRTMGTLTCRCEGKNSKTKSVNDTTVEATCGCDTVGNKHKVGSQN